MAFPPFPAGPVDGLGVYPKPPLVLDKSDRRELHGERRDAVTYVCQRAGQFTIPAARLTWFDLETQTLQTIDFPARPFEVAPNPAMISAPPSAAQAAPADAGRNIVVALVAVLGLNGLAFLAWKTRAVWRPLIDVFRPVHLAPMNPPPRSHSRSFP